MKRRAFLFLTAMFLAAFAVFAAETPNRILKLDGGNSYAELPSGAFNDLEEATIEGWVKWTDNDNWARFFDFGQAWRAIYVTRWASTPGVTLIVHLHRGTAAGDYAAATGANLFRTNQWCHLAAVIARGRATLYFNGLPIASASYPGAFNTVQRGERNYLGRENWWDEGGSQSPADTPERVERAQGRPGARRHSGGVGDDDRRSKHGLHAGCFGIRVQAH